MGTESFGRSYEDPLQFDQQPLEAQATVDACMAAFEATGDRPILEQAEEAGVLMPSGCRMGICYSCVLPLREGTVRDLRSGEVTTATAGDGVLVQTCVSAAAGACDIDL